MSTAITPPLSHLIAQAIIGFLKATKSAQAFIRATSNLLSGDQTLTSSSLLQTTTKFVGGIFVPAP